MQFLIYMFHMNQNGVSHWHRQTWSDEGHETITKSFKGDAQ